MNLIQYRLTDKPRFFLLKDVPDTSHYMTAYLQGLTGISMKDRIKLCESKALEIVNPELIWDEKQVGNLLYFGTSLKHNDTFPVPEGVEFEEELICNKMSCAHSEGCYADGLSFETCAAKKFIRLSKKEEKEDEWPKDLIGNDVAREPVKEDDQDELWSLVFKQFCQSHYGKIDIDKDKAYFTIQRKQK